MKIHAIDYKRRWGNDGTVYRQTIKIDRELQRKYNNRIKYLKKKIDNKSVISYEEGKILSYTDTLKVGVNYLHLTGLEKFIGLVWKNLGKNERLLYRNTIIEVL